MEREHLRPKLIGATASDYPSATEILVSFPEEWELVERMSRGNTPLYIAAMQPEEERPRRDQFYGLSPEINLTLTAYRLYKFFRPWPMPSIVASWNVATGRGRVERVDDLKVQLQSIGQAQAWFGETYGVLWECYFDETRRREPGWQEELAAIWRIVEKSMEVTKMFTQPREPAFEEGYAEFLTRLGYEPDASCPKWWSKAMR